MVSSSINIIYKIVEVSTIMLNYRLAVYGGVVLAIAACTAGPVEPTVKPSSSPTQSSSANPIATPTPSPSATIPIPSPQPSPSAEVLELFVQNQYCEPVAKTLSANIGNLNDIAVSPDGKDIYVLYTQPYREETSANGVRLIRPQQLIYKLEGKSLVSDAINQKITGDTCHLMSEIEKDGQGGFYLVKRNFSTVSPSGLPKGYTFYRFTPKINSFESIETIDLGEPEPSPSARPDARQLQDLNVPTGQSQTLYYKLSTGHYSLRTAFIQKLTFGSKREDIITLKSGGTPSNFVIVDAGKLLYKDWFVRPPYPVDENGIYDEKGNLIPQVTKVIDSNKEGLYYSYRMTMDRKFIYAAEHLKTHSILKIDVDKNTVEAFVGSGKAGFSDGQGSSAQFNQIARMDVDAQGNLYVVDSGNKAIRKVTPAGAVSTLYSVN